ncbi:MAG: hypothetical protein OEM26_19010, partial [Saprospiraceae bacterium]|nr:hypothetical protein [Saprospiraceae bacterium]
AGISSNTNPIDDSSLKTGMTTSIAGFTIQVSLKGANVCDFESTESLAKRTVALKTENNFSHGSFKVPYPYFCSFK